MSSLGRPLLTRGLIAIASWGVSATPLDAQDRIVLRSLKIISDRTVQSFDEDGVRLDDDSVITWDEIERGSIDEGKQADFDRMLKELGGPLYRVRQRLKVGDYPGLLEHAETLYPRYEAGRSPTAYLVIQALMWGRLAAGQREFAVEPYLRAYEHLRAAKSGGNALPGNRRLQFDSATALSSELIPVWFDQKAAAEALPGVFSAVKAMRQPYPEGVYIYYATLASAAGQPERATSFLRPIGDKNRSTAQWRDITQAQIEVLGGQSGQAVRRLELAMDSLLPEIKPAAIYWLGVSMLSGKESSAGQEGVLQLLHLPALYGKKYPELAAAGLYESMLALEKADDATGSVALRKELLVRYAHTVHAQRLKRSGP